MTYSAELEKFASGFLEKRQTHSCTTSLKKESQEFILEVIDFLFPHFSTKVYFTPEDVLAKMQLLGRNLCQLLKLTGDISSLDPQVTAEKFIGILPALHDQLWADAESIYKGDPAAESVDEVIVAYPGFYAIIIYRVAHTLYQLHVPIIPRIFTEFAHEKTGIDIHPGATIGSPFFIDHGTGIVIGETTVIGRNVKIYQGVTLGALSVDKKLSDVKRHPTIEDNVIIYAQAVILGGDTVIGANSVIGGNSWVTSSIEPNSVVYNKSEVRIKTTKERDDDYLDFCI